MTHAFFLGAEVAARRRRIFEAVVADDDVAAHAAGQVDDDIDLAFTDALDYFAVVLRLHAEPAGLRLAHVNVNDGCACFGRFDRRRGDLLRRHRAMRALGHLGVIAGHGTADDDVVVHGVKSSRLAGKWLYYNADNN